MKYFSIFYLGCETLSILQWRDVTFIRMLYNNLYYVNRFNKFKGVICELQGYEYYICIPIAYNLPHILDIFSDLLLILIDAICLYGYSNTNNIILIFLNIFYDDRDHLLNYINNTI